MVRTFIENLGVFLVPQALLSVLVFALIAAYALAHLRGELRRAPSPVWRRSLDSLGSIAVSVGLLGSVWSFMTTFANTSGRLEIDRVIAGLGTAYTTTGVGLITAIIAAGAVFVFDGLAGQRHDAPAGDEHTDRKAAKA
jgi:hypothetical protein